MSFYTEISPFIDYIKSIRKLENYITFDMLFPTKWSLPKNIIDEKQVVGFQTEESNYKGISFVTELNSESVNKILVVISKVIKLNQEREIKEKLFKQTIEELKKTFEETDLDKLQNLYFDFASDTEDTSKLDAYDTESTIELVGK